MRIVRAYQVHDELRNKEYASIREAHEVYAPEIPYSSFKYRILNGKYKHLKCKMGFVQVIDRNRDGQRILSDDGTKWSSIRECAESLGVTRRAVQNALKRKRPCKGHNLTLEKGNE